MVINVMTYNIHGGKDIEGNLTLYGISNLIKETGADIIGLQEIDVFLKRSYFLNEIKYLANRLKMHYVFGPNLRMGFGSFGNGILSRYPIAKKKNYHIYSVGERRGVLTALIQLNENKKIWFLTTHLGLNRKERLTQSQEILKIVSNLEYPVIMTGDFNEAPGEEAYSTISRVLKDAANAQNSVFHTYVDGCENVRIDYIMHSKGVWAESIKAIDSTLSDHLPVVASLRCDF